MRVRVTIPARYTALGEAVHTSTKQLGEDGVFVRCVEPPMLGSMVMLRLWLAGGDEPVDAGAEIAEVAIDPDNSGFWATFHEPTDELIERVRETLVRVRAGEEAAKVGPAGAVINRRTEQRFLDRLVVKLGGRGIEPGVFAHNISSTGLFVLMPNPPELDTVMTLSLELPDKGDPVTVLGHVVRRLTPEQAAKQRTAPGAGLVFVGGSEEFRKRYDAYLKALGQKKRA
ncbi:MAG: PilZ domain-containing protein [Deltaproteobacteria bacterium]|nr:PilZ domain-containing protein [Deltaproteobacteria bacterium]